MRGYRLIFPSLEDQLIKKLKLVENNFPDNLIRESEVYRDLFLLLQEYSKTQLGMEFRIRSETNQEMHCYLSYLNNFHLLASFSKDREISEFYVLSTSLLLINSSLYIHLLKNTKLLYPPISNQTKIVGSPIKDKDETFSSEELNKKINNIDLVDNSNLKNVNSLYLSKNKENIEEKTVSLEPLSLLECKKKYLKNDINFDNIDSHQTYNSGEERLNRNEISLNDYLKFETAIFNPELCKVFEIKGDIGNLNHTPPAALLNNICSKFFPGEAPTFTVEKVGLSNFKIILKFKNKRMELVGKGIKATKHEIAFMMLKRMFPTIKFYYGYTCLIKRKNVDDLLNNEFR